ncbi:hypothetical protein HLB23_06255 [Nocardia uniformis]|uniref:Uncharacterized protein n=1 Tax=Nocardia uniformis TaxID=53432 RepID=A0A849BZF4_9NOCA|nr:hypothetical protein [Nocardia uniformis]NNH69475.1 hypothetical protein [Nocardia uniformis]
MDQREREQLRSANDELRRRFDRAMQTFEQARPGDITAQVAGIRMTAASCDRLAEATVDATGVLVDLRFAVGACRRPAADISRAVTEAAAEARRLAMAQTETLIAPFAAVADEVAELWPDDDQHRI